MADRDRLLDFRNGARVSLLKLIVSAKSPVMARDRLIGLSCKSLSAELLVESRNRLLGV